MTKAKDEPAELTDFQRVFNLLILAVKQSLAECPDLTSVTLIADWKTKEIDYPSGIMIGRQGHVSRPDEILGASHQTMKMLSTQFGLLQETLHGVDDLMSRMSQELVKRERQFNNSDDIDIPPTGSADP